MTETEERYSPGRVDQLKRMLDREAQLNRTRDYEIKVDGIKVVPRTKDLDEFYDFEPEITPETKNLTVVIYEYNNNRNRVYSFFVNQENNIPASPENGLGALGEIDQLIKQKIEQKDNEYKRERLQEKLAETQAKLDDAEEFIEVLKGNIADLKANKYTINGQNVIELCGELIRQTIYSNAGKSPAMAQVAGVLGALNPSPQSSTNAQAELPPEEATFREAAAPPQLNERQLQILASIQQMESRLKGEQLMIMNGIIIRLMECPDELSTVAELLNIKTSGNGKV